MSLLPGLTVLSTSREPDGYRARLRLEPESPLLAGHFPGDPILPGVAHLGLGLQGAAALYGPEFSLEAVRNVRFRHPVRPGGLIELSVLRGAELRSVRFELRSGVETLSHGLIVVRSDDVA